MNLMIKAFGAENLYGAKPEEGTDRNAGKKHIFGGNLHLAKMLGIMIIPWIK